MMRQYAVIFVGTFSLHSNSNLTSTVALLTDSFCREQSIITNGPLRRNNETGRLGSIAVKNEPKSNADAKIKTLSIKWYKEEEKKEEDATLKKRK